MRRNPQAGQALYLTAISLVVLVGMLGLGVDMGVLRYEKRLQQTAADAAALAGANDLRYDGGAGVSEAALNAASANNFADTGGGNVSGCGPTADVRTVCVQVDSAETTGGPLSGPHVNNPNYVEVLVAAVQPTYFMRIFGKNQETVIARAVATNVSGGPSTPCLLSLSASATLNVVGEIKANLCSIIANGNLSISGAITGATSIGAGGGCSGSSIPACVPGVPAIADPVASLPTSPPDGCSGGLVGLLLNFCKGIIGGGSLPLDSSLYVLSSGLSVQPGATLNLLNAAGKTIYIPSGTIDIGAGATLNAPGAMIVAQSIKVNGTLNVSLDGSGSSPIKNAVLVE